MHNTGNIDEYIAEFPEDVQKLLEQIRVTIRKAVPDAKEKIGYGIPTFTLEGNLVHFAGYKNHIGFYPGPGAIDAFKDELLPYKLSKGTVQFPIDKALPHDLITKIVHLGVKHNLEKAALKSAKKPKAKSDDPFSALSAPARRALENAAIKTLKQLAAHTEKDVKELHGMGPNALEKLHSALKEAGLAFKK